ncbi:hypothetical protein KFE98_17795 [bacterium SCSIO 12741]|nr:hypothetical protein KFE98_17795 [bacterium SCSIO 12741]
MQKIGRYESAYLFIWLLVWYSTVGEWIPAVVLILWSCSLSSYFMLTSQYNLRSEDAPKLLKIFDIIGGISTSLLMMGLLFRTMLYPGYSMILNIGMIALIVQVSLLGVPRIRNHVMPDMGKLMIRYVILGGVGGFYWLVYLI